MTTGDHEKQSGRDEENNSGVEHRPSYISLSNLTGVREPKEKLVAMRTTKSSDREHPTEALDSLPSWAEDDHIETPRSETPSIPSSIPTPVPSWTSEENNDLSRDSCSTEGEVISDTIRNSFEPIMLPNSDAVDLARAASASTLSSTSEDSFAGSRRDSISAPQSPERYPSVWRDVSALKVSDFTPRHEPPRPTSVPNFQSQSATGKRKDGTGYPTYPNQSFATLHSQQYPPSYQPHPLRTRSSHPSQSSSYSSSASRSRDYPNLPSGAKTAGHTPAQSPGLFTPTTARSRPSGDESEESYCNTPILHPSHLQAPKETHKLLKDVDPISGRKLVNNYEFFEKLGSGTHGTVKLGKNLNTGELVAVKIVRRFSKKLRLGKSGGPNDMIKKEVAILKKARHPHVVSLLEVIDDDEFGKVYLILEYVELGEIIWRKQTDKDVATFEMNRVKREKLGTSDNTTEHAEIEKFNATVTFRRAAKAQASEEQRGQGQKRIGGESLTESSHVASASHFWSLEYGNEPEEERASGSGPQYGLRPPPVERDMSQGTNTCSPESGTPAQSDTPRPPQPNLSDTEFLRTASGPRPNSHPESPVSLEGTTHGPYPPDPWSSNTTFRAKFDQAVASQLNWTAEEEEFMHVPCLTIAQALDAFRDTVLGLEYLHFQGIIHRDIKPSNLLWTLDHRVKISDFGVSYLGKPIREDEHNEEIPEADVDNLDEALELAKTVGTPAFYAPELCDPELFDSAKHPERPQITGQIDVWALGVTLYCMIFGRLPFFDVNEFAMYEKIARQEVFIPQVRLRGVQDDVKNSENPINHDKRPDDILEYEEVDDELRDLIRKLLIKQPTKRISLKGVKNHPWVLRGIGDKSAWVEQTDPSLQSQGKKIEVSPHDVQEAVVGLTIVDRIKSGIRRIGSVVRGRDHRKRGHSSAKILDTQASTSPSSSSMGTGSPHERRSSLRGDEQIFSAARVPREGTEHPLSHSVAASPESKLGVSYFESENMLNAAREYAAENRSYSRPSFLERTLSNAESTKTIRPSVQVAIQEIALKPAEHFSPMIPVVAASSTSSLGGIFGGAGRRFVNTMRSRERGRGRDSRSQSSRSSSADASITGTDDPHGSPSVAFSSAFAAGHVDVPSALHDISPEDALPLEQDPSTSYSRVTSNSSTEMTYSAQGDSVRRHSVEYSHIALDRRYRVSPTAEVRYPSSPADQSLHSEHHDQVIQPEEALFGISSSSDQIASGISESTSYPSIPSVVSGASSLSAQADDPYPQAIKEPLRPAITLSSDFGSEISNEDTRPLSIGHHLRKAKSRIVTDDDEAGYNGEGEFDSDSDDDGIEIGGGRGK